VGVSEIVRNLGIVVGAGLGLLIALQRPRAATRQAEAALNAHMQEVFATAVSNLDSENLAVRLGGMRR